MISFTHLLAASTALTTAYAAAITTRTAEYQCYNDEWLFTSDMTTAITAACKQIGSVIIAKNDWKGATISSLHLEGAPIDEEAELFLSFKNTAVDAGWYIDENFCNIVATQLMTHCAGKHSDSSGGIWNRAEGTVDLDANNKTPKTEVDGGHFAPVLDSSPTCAMGSQVYAKDYECSSDYGIHDTYEGCYNIEGATGAANGGYFLTENVAGSCTLYDGTNCDGNTVGVVESGGTLGHLEVGSCQPFKAPPKSFWCQEAGVPI